MSYKDGRLLRKYNKIVLTSYNTVLSVSIANNSKASLSADLQGPPSSEALAQVRHG